MYDMSECFQAVEHAEEDVFSEILTEISNILEIEFFVFTYSILHWSKCISSKPIFWILFILMFNIMHVQCY